MGNQIQKEKQSILEPSIGFSDQNLHPSPQLQENQQNQNDEYLPSQVALELATQPNSQEQINPLDNQEAIKQDQTQSSDVQNSKLISDQSLDVQKQFIAQIPFILATKAVFEVLIVYFLYDDLKSYKNKDSPYMPIMIPFLLAALYITAFLSTRNFAKGAFVSLLSFSLIIAIQSYLSLCVVSAFSSETDPKNDGFQVSSAGLVWFLVELYISYEGFIQLLTMIYVLCLKSTFGYQTMSLTLILPLLIPTLLLFVTAPQNIILFIQSMSQMRFFINVQQGKCAIRIDQTFAAVNHSIFNMIFPFQCFF